MIHGKQLKWYIVAKSIEAIAQCNETKGSNNNYSIAWCTNIKHIRSKCVTVT